MVKLIQKCGFFTNDATAYMRYIAAREGVEIVAGNGPATVRQRQIISSLLKDFPDLSELFEYGDYLSNQTTLNASAFISSAFDFYQHEIQQRNIYMKYIATRPHVEKHGTHGLFSAEPITDLNTAMNSLSAHDGTVWTFIYSLHREDAARLGYESAESWRKLLLAHEDDLATSLKISPNHLKWYAAFHNEEHHPHIHLMAWSESNDEGFLSKRGIEKMRSALTNDIFEAEMHELYSQKDLAYATLRDTARSAMRDAIEKMRSDLYMNDEITKKMYALVCALETCKGKKQYGYLPKPVKSIVDGIVDELEKQPDVAACYETWCNLHEQIEAYYVESKYSKLPLSERKEFRAIKNLIIKDAETMRLGGAIFEDDATSQECLLKQQAYKRGRSLLQSDSPSDWKVAISYFEEAASAGNKYAQYQLGKMYLTGKYVEKDIDRAIVYLNQSASQGNKYAVELLERIDQFPDPALLFSATRLLHHMSRIFRANSIIPANPEGARIDSKRRKKLQQKRLAAGHKADDHEDYISPKMAIW